MSEPEENRLEITDMFEGMFKKHLENTNNDLVINNLVLLRNVLKLVAKGSDLEEADVRSLERVEGFWRALNKGCGCTKDKRIEEANGETIRFASSDQCKSILTKVKSIYELSSLNIDIPTPPSFAHLKYEI